MSDDNAADNVPEGTRFTPDELQDLVVAAKPGSQPEAMFLANQLEDAGIPVALEDPGMWGSNMNPSMHAECTLRVPRKALEEAKAVIARARENVHEQNVQAAFAAESKPEDVGDASHDYTLWSMQEMKEIEIECRLERLRPIVSEWLLDDIEPLKMARYLGAAGLTRDQAAELVESVSKTVAEEWQERGDARRSLGIVLMVIGVLAIFFTPLVYQKFKSYPGHGYGQMFWIAFPPFVLGLFLFSTSRKKLRTLPRAPKDETAATENSSTN